MTNPALYAMMPYDAMKHFEPMSLLGRAPIVIYTNPTFPPNNVKELVALAIGKPGTLNFGSAGPASMTHLTAELLKLQQGLDMTRVVYRWCAGAEHLLAGQIPMTFERSSRPYRSTKPAWCARSAWLLRAHKSIRTSPRFASKASIFS